MSKQGGLFVILLIELQSESSREIASFKVLPLWFLKNFRRPLLSYLTVAASFAICERIEGTIDWSND